MNDELTQNNINVCLAQNTLRGQKEAILIAIRSLKDLDGKYFRPSFGGFDFDMHCCDRRIQGIAFVGGY